jgi:hyperosmotically inducible protein
MRLADFRTEKEGKLMKHHVFRRGASTLIIASLGLLVCTACDRTTDASRTAAADNTARNVRDKDGNAPTPMNQGESQGDLAITQHVRKTVTDNDALSTNAHNVKIVTQNGVVTLRGPVNSATEKATIVAAAQRAPGVTRVDDQLEVKATN